ncbi:MAG: hypothetical protein N2512_05820 [Armatimonadetes bacterium]|nr:hypothetical protein [Armatimonadota bacterium]
MSRRFGPPPVACLFTSRHRLDRQDFRTGLPVLPLPPLHEEAQNSTASCWRCVPKLWSIRYGWSCMLNPQ